MALALGTENKKQVYILAALAVFIVAAAGYEIYDYFSGPPSRPIPQTVPTPALRTPAGSGAQGGSGAEAQKLTNADIDPALHLDKLAQSELIAYAGTGRNIFSPNSAPPTPIAPPRPNPNTVAQIGPPPPPPPPKPPDIDLKYFGYSQDTGKAFKAFLIHGEDIFMAHSGEIVDHRYKVGSIRPLSIEITDLAYNNTQTIQLTPN